MTNTQGSVAGEREDRAVVVLVSSAQRRTALVAGLAVVMMLLFVLTVLCLLPMRVLIAPPLSTVSYDTLASYLTKGLATGRTSLLRSAIQPAVGVAVFRRGVAIDSVTFDSLVVLDSSYYPSLRRGGFLRDEVERFNRFQRRRLERIEATPGSQGIPNDLTSAANPSVFRTTHRIAFDGADTIVLAEYPIMTRMRVASPTEQLRTMYITTKDAPRSLAFLSPLGATIAAEGAYTPTSARCPMFRVGDSIAVQCLSHASPRIAGSEVSVYLGDGAEKRPAIRPIVGATRYDGMPLRPNTPVFIKRGGIVQFPASGRRPSEPVAIDQAVGGTLIGTQWVNGQIRWRPNPALDMRLLRQLATGIGSGVASGLPDGAVIPLSLDEALTVDLKRALNRFLTRTPQARGNLAYALVVLANASSGEVIGVAEVDNHESDAPSWVFRPLNVGSAIKPILAAAALLERPELASLEIRDVGGSVSELWGLPLHKPFATGCGSGGWIDLSRFLSCSSNLYAASLVAASLTRPGSPLTLDAAPGVEFRLANASIRGRRPHIPVHDGAIAQDTLANSALAAGLFRLAGLTTSMEYAGGVGRVGRDSTIWRGLSTAGGAQSVRVPPGVWPEVSRLALAPSGASVSLRVLAGYAIGTGENQVTSLKLTEAFTRILTDRQVELTLVPVRGVRDWPSLRLRDASWYTAMLRGLAGVGREGGTAPFLESALQSRAPGLSFFGKTGTIDESGKPYTRVRDVVVDTGARPVVVRVSVDDTLPPVVAKSLVFGVGRRDGGGAALRCGITGTVYVRLSSKRGFSRLDPIAAEFARDELWTIVASHWNRLRIC